MPCRPLRRRLAALIFLVLLFAWGKPCSAGSDALLTIGVGPDSVHLLLAELTGLLLKARGLSVAVRDGIPPADLPRRLAAGEVDLCFIETTAPASPADRVPATTPLPPLPFAAGQVVVMRRQQADALGIAAASDLAAHPALRYAAAPELAALRRVYGLSPATPKVVPADLIYRALRKESIDVGVGRATDGRIVAFRLAILKDDRLALTNSRIIPIVRTTTLGDHPEIEAELTRLGRHLDLTAIQRLDANLLLAHRDADELAREWLKREKLLQEK